MGRTSNAKEKLLEVAFRLIWDSSYGSVSVDDICEQAEVKKGSFYHFFDSKAALAMAAYEEHWQAKQPIMDRLFSPQVPGLKRLSDWCHVIYETQKEKAAEHGHVCGCPYASVGGEIATQDDQFRARCELMMTRMMKYIESAIADAKREGTSDCPDPKAAANQVNSFILGTLLQAKIQNDLEVVRTMEPTLMSIVGAIPEKKNAATLVAA